MTLDSISILENYSFGLEKYKDRLRFIIFFEGEELACRKEETKVLKSFFQSEGQGLFQGRIKLRSEKKHLIVYLKGQCIGTIDKTVVEKSINVFLNS